MIPATPNGPGPRMRILAASVLWILTLGAPATGQDAQAVEGAGPGEVFAAIASAWSQEDQQGLADRVHPDGLRVDLAGNRDRSIHYSPSQAFYFFKNLFQGQRTLSFRFQRTQDDARGERAHGLAAWRSRRPSSENVKETKLVFVLELHEGRWMLSEITTIK